MTQVQRPRQKQGLQIDNQSNTHKTHLKNFYGYTV